MGNSIKENPADEGEEECYSHSNSEEKPDTILWSLREKLRPQSFQINRIPKRDKTSEAGLDTHTASLPTEHERKTRPPNKPRRNMLEH